MFLYKVFEREITSLVSEKQSARGYEVDWNASNYPSGVYFYRIAIHSDKFETGEYTNVKKMMLIK